MTEPEISIELINDKRGRARFVDLGRAFAARTAHSVPQLRGEQLELINPRKNPFFGHARAQFIIAHRGGEPVGRISAHIDELALEMPREQGFGPGKGMFGYFDAADAAVAQALLSAAEGWLRDQGMSHAIGPISLSIWEEPGLLVGGHDHPPMIMMGHHPPQYQGWIKGAGYDRVQTLLTYDIEIQKAFPPLIQRIVRSGERNPRITIRNVRKARWDEDAEIVLGILNDAWSENWGFVPFTPAEVAYAGKKLKPLIHEDLNMIAELDGRPVAFMLTFPDINDPLSKIGGKLWPLGWLRLLRWLRKPMRSGMRVPLMGVNKELHNSRLASQLAFMMISAIRDVAHERYDATRGEIGWILEGNQGMVAIAETIESKVNREYAIFEKAIDRVV